MSSTSPSSLPPRMNPWRIAAILTAVGCFAIVLLVVSVAGLWYGILGTRRELAVQANAARGRDADDWKYLADASIEFARGARLETPIFDFNEAILSLQTGDDIDVYRVVEWMATTDPDDAGSIAEQEQLVRVVEAIGTKYGEELAGMTARVAGAWRASMTRAQQQDADWHEERRARRAALEETRPQRTLERLMKLEQEAASEAAASGAPPFLNQFELQSATSAQRRANADRLRKDGQDRMRRRQEDIRRHVALLPSAGEK